MAVSLIHQYLGAGMSTARRHSVADLRPVDLFDDLDDAELEPMGGRGRAARAEARRCSLAEQGSRGRRPPACWRGGRRCSMLDGDREEPVGDQERADVVRGDRRADPRAGRRCRMAAPDRRAGGASSRPTTSERLALRRRAGAPARDGARCSPVMSAGSARSSRTASGWPSLGTMAAGLAHELNNPAAAAKRSSLELGEALEVLTSAVANFVEAGVSRDGAAAAGRAAARGARRTPRPAPSWTRWTPPTRRTSWPSGWRSWASWTPTGWPSRWPPPASTATGWTASRRSPARPPARGVVWVAASLTAAVAGRRAGRFDRPHQPARERGQVLRLHGPRAGPSRSTSTRAWRRRSRSWATSSSTRRSRSCATTTATCPR